MRASFSIIIALLFFSTIVAVSPGCDDSIEFANTPPGELTITKSKCYLGPEDSVVLTGSATDADNDSISYSWTAEEGVLTPSDGKGRVVTWRAPDSHGTFRVTFKATDGLDVSSKGIDLDVGRNLDIVHDGGVIDQTDYPYIVPNALPINIGDLVTVTIEAGVTIIFNEGGGGFRVRGTLIVNGTAQDRVLFAPNSCPGEDRVWKGIIFTGSSASGNMNYATLTSTADGLTVEDSAELTTDHLIIDQSTADGLSVKTSGSAVVTEARIWDNGGGIYLGGGSLQISDSSIRYNNNYGFSILTGGLSTVNVQSCVVANNGQYGFVLGGDSNPVVNNCSLFFNGPEMEIRTVRFINTYSYTGSVNMTGNYWGTDVELEIPPQIIRDGSYGVVDYSGWLSDDPL